MNRLILAVLAAAALAGAAKAQPSSPPVSDKQASIPFVDYGGVTDWRTTAAGDLLLRGTGDDYYRAQFMGPCPNLGYAMRIGIPGGAMDSLDRFSNVYVDGMACPLKSVTRVDQTVWNAAG